jgi:two-component system, NarL family, invasion response regulator UvrY
MSIRIAIADDHDLIRTGLKNYLSDFDGFLVVGEAASGAEAQRLVREQRPDVLIMDISMPGLSGIDVLTSLRAQYPQLGILILSGYPEAHYALPMLKQGANAYLSKQCESEEIVAAVRKLATGGKYISQAVAELLANQIGAEPAAQERPAHAQLSEREMQVFLRLAKGQAVGDIASELNVSAKSVSTYRTRLLEKLGLASNSDLTYYALKNGLIE